ncbi:MAG: hypothetical protein H0U75_09930 [Legionella sp.]|nr:hypothetical protein [Legionella sp.]
MFEPVWCPTLKTWLTFKQSDKGFVAYLTQSTLNTSIGCEWIPDQETEFWIVEHLEASKAFFLNEGQIICLSFSSFNTPVIQQYDVSSESFLAISPTLKRKLQALFSNMEQAIKLQPKAYDLLESRPLNPDMIAEQRLEIEQKAEQERLTIQREQESKAEEHQSRWLEWRSGDIRENFAASINGYFDGDQNIIGAVYESFSQSLLSLDPKNFNTMEGYKQSLEDCLTGKNHLMFKGMESAASQTYVNDEQNLNPTHSQKLTKILTVQKLNYIFEVLKAEHANLLEYFNISSTPLVTITDRPNTALIAIDERRGNQMPVRSIPPIDDDLDLQMAIAASLMVDPQENKEVKRATPREIKEVKTHEVHNASQANAPTPQLKKSELLENHYFKLKCYGIISGLLLAGGILVLACLGLSMLPLTVGCGLIAGGLLAGGLTLFKYKVSKPKEAPDTPPPFALMT